MHRNEVLDKVRQNKKQTKYKSNRNSWEVNSKQFNKKENRLTNFMNDIHSDCINYCTAYFL